jgi:hypothetical protein
MEVLQLLYEIIFLQTPDDRSDATSGYTIATVACIANKQFGVEDGLGLSGISRRGHRWHLRDMRRRGHCAPVSGSSQRGQNDQNAEYSRKVIVDHFTLPLFEYPGPHDATNALEPL